MKLKGEMTTVIAGLQWLSFLFVNTVVIPLSIGEAYDMTALEISGNMARSFILTGAASLIQALWSSSAPYGRTNRVVVGSYFKYGFHWCIVRAHNC